MNLIEVYAKAAWDVAQAALSCRDGDVIGTSGSGKPQQLEIIRQPCFNIFALRPRTCKH
jgi:hypothetical protein